MGIKPRLWLLNLLLIVTLMGTGNACKSPKDNCFHSDDISRSERTYDNPERELNYVVSGWTTMDGLRNYCEYNIYTSGLILHSDQIDGGRAFIITNVEDANLNRTLEIIDQRARPKIEEDLELIRQADSAILYIVMNPLMQTELKAMYARKEAFGTLRSVRWYNQNEERFERLGIHPAIIDEMLDTYAAGATFTLDEYRIVEIGFDGSPPYWFRTGWGNPSEWPSCQQWDFMRWLKDTGHTVDYGIQRWPDPRELECQVYPN